MATNVGTEENQVGETASRTLGTGANRCLVAVIAFYSNTELETVSSVVFDTGGANEKLFTRLNGSIQSGAPALRVDIWYAVAPASGASGTIKTTFSGSVPSQISVTEWTGVDQTTPLENYTSAENWGNAPTVNVTSETGAIVVDIICRLTASGAGTQGAGQTLQMDLEATTRGSSSTEAGAATVTMSWSWATNTNWLLAGASINPS